MFLDNLINYHLNGYKKKKGNINIEEIRNSDNYDCELASL